MYLLSYQRSSWSCYWRRFTSDLASFVQDNWDSRSSFLFDVYAGLTRVVIERQLGVALFEAAANERASGDFLAARAIALEAYKSWTIARTLLHMGLHRGDRSMVDRIRVHLRRIAELEERLENEMRTLSR